MKKPLLKGVGANVGVTKGRAAVVLSPQEMAKVEEGSVLVTPATNPLFTPAILKAKALITDTGGVLCHSAIVARELDIPCVVGTKKATEILRDGQLVVVDGKKGVVYYGRRQS